MQVKCLGGLKLPVVSSMRCSCLLLRWKHWCSKVTDSASNRVCWDKSHGEHGHK